ncbi:MAG TPA: hypothetical protein DCF70_01625 [Treponema sp.]|nr:hypothetical protein [Treponema sp.]
MKICPKCNEKFDSGKFCKFCGSALQDELQEIHCRSCGAILKDDAKFCPDCGAKVGVFETNGYQSNNVSTDLNLDNLDEYDLDYLLEQEEKTHNAKIQVEIGKRYLFDDDSAHDSLAKDFFKKAADQNDADGLYWLGQCFFYGYGGSEIKTKAIDLYKKAAELRNTGALMALGIECVKKNEEDAFGYFVDALENGERNAYYWLALCYERGYGCEQDAEKAFENYKKAVEYNDTDSYALEALGECYLYGQGTAMDDGEAFKLFKKACSVDETNSYAQEKLGACYRNGWGTQINISKAIQHYKKAAEQNNTDAQNSLGMIYLNGEGDITTNETKAYQYFKKSADNGNTIAMNNMGYCCEKGIGCNVNPEKAFNWYKNSAESGNADGRFQVGLCFHSGYGCEKDEDYGLQLIQEAAEQGSENAQEFLKNPTSNSSYAPAKSNAGKIGGAATGAAIGTAILPGVGTVIGGVLGGLFGSKVIDND